MTTGPLPGAGDELAARAPAMPQTRPAASTATSEMSSSHRRLLNEP